MSSIEELERKAADYRARVAAYITPWTTMWWGIMTPAAKRFVASVEKEIADVASSALTTRELRRRVALRVREEFVGKLMPAPNAAQMGRCLPDYFDALIDVCEAKRECLGGEWRELVTFRGHEATVLWSGDEVRGLVRRVTAGFLEYYMSRTAPHEYSARQITEFTGVTATHLLEQALRRQGAEVRVGRIDIKKFAPTPPPPPPGLYLGKVNQQPYSLPEANRDKTVYIIGVPGMGKSTLMASMIRQDIRSGKGVGVIDPAGDLAKAALSYVPKERIADCIYIDPFESPVGIDFFRAKNDEEREMIQQDLVTIFKRLTTGSETYEQMYAVLERSVQLLAQHPGATFLDIYRLLNDEAWRESIVMRVEDAGLREFWLREYPKYPHPQTERPIKTRLQKFDASKALRTITGTISSLSFYDAIRERKIIIINLAKSRLKEGPALILGALFVSQFQLAAFRQGELPLEDRIPFHLYVDEFQNFATSAFNEIVNEARKFKLCLTLANQTLTDLDIPTRGAALKASTRIHFRLQDDDARKLAGSLPEKYDAHVLMNLPEFDTILRPGRPIDSVALRTDVPPRREFDHAGEIIRNTQRTYPSHASTPRGRRSEDETGEEPSAGGPPPE